MGLDQVRYKGLGYVALNVSDIDRSRAFYTEIVGLREVGEIDEQVLLRAGNSHHDIMLCPAGAKRPGVKRIGWETESEAASTAVREELARIGVAVQEVPEAEQAALGVGGAFRAIDPTTGATHEFFHRMAFAETAFKPTHTRLEGIGHVVLSTARMEESRKFYMDTLNFRVSDQIGDIVLHMRCFPNPLHHTFGLGAGSAAQLHHLTFMVHHVDDIGRANKRMRDYQVPIVYGPGRHPQSGSFFFYFLDPDGMTLEYSQGMEEFSERDPRPPRKFNLQVDSMDYWGNLPEPGFAQIGEIESAAATEAA